MIGKSANGFLAAALLFAGCQASTVTPRQATLGAAHSWMRPGSKQGPLIYSNGSLSAVLIFDFSGDLVGELGGLDEPTGLCSDATGDVYVTDMDLQLIYKYPAGGTLPVDIYDDRGNLPIACAVDPTTGSLAVINEGTEGTNGDVAIYPPGNDSNPAVYATPNLSIYSFGGYDPSGNLYVDGTGAKQSFQLAVLEKGSGGLVPVPVSGLNNKKHRVAGVLWDGTYVAVGDALAGAVYRLAVAGGSAKVVQTVRLRGWAIAYRWSSQ